MLTCEESFPLSWTPLTQEEIALQTISWHAVNAEALRAYLSLEHGVTEKTDEDPRLVQELQRLEGKLDLLLGLVTQFILREQPLPSSVKCRLSSQGAEWEEDEAPGVGQLILVTMYLSPRYPCPVCLPATVAEVIALPDGYHVRVEFLPMLEGVQESLERLVFLHHRKQVAQSHKR